MGNYTCAYTLKYRDYLIAKGMAGSSASRVISSIRAVMNFAISEYGLDLKNPFLGMYHNRLAGVSKRLPIPIEDIRKVQHKCLFLDNVLRWLVDLVPDRVVMFFTAANRNMGYVIQHLGDRPIDTYSSLDAASFRDWLVRRNLLS